MCLRTPRARHADGAPSTSLGHGDWAGPERCKTSRCDSLRAVRCTLTSLEKGRDCCPRGAYERLSGRFSRPFDHRAHALGSCAKRDEDLRGDRRRQAADREEDVLGLERAFRAALLDRQLEDLLRVRSKAESAGDRLPLAGWIELGHLDAQGLDRELQLVEHARHLLVDVAELAQPASTDQEVLGFDRAVAHADRLVLGHREGSLRTMAHAVERTPPPWR